MSNYERYVVPVVVLLAVTVITGCGATKTTGTSSSTGHSVRYADPGGWAVAYPSVLKLEHSASGARFVAVSEVTIANFAASPGVHTWSSRGSGGIRVEPPLNSSGWFPSDGVAFRIVAEDGGPWHASSSTSRFPLKIAAFRPSRLPRGVLFNATTGETTGGFRYRGLPRSRMWAFEIGNDGYTAIVWIGSDASSTVRATLAHTIASLVAARPHPYPLG